MKETGPNDREPSATHGAGDPTYEDMATAAAEPLEDAVEQLLDQVGAETQTQQIVQRDGLRGRAAIVTGAFSLRWSCLIPGGKRNTLRFTTATLEPIVNPGKNDSSNESI